MVKRILFASGVLALAGTGAVHLYLYLDGHLPGNGVGYRQIQTVGPLFLLTVVVAGALALALALLSSGAVARTVPAALRALVALVGAAFSASVLGGYVLTLLLPKGLFQFTEPSVSYAGGLSILAEAGGAVVLLALAGVVAASSRRGQAPVAKRSGSRRSRSKSNGVEGRQIPTIPPYR